MKKFFTQFSKVVILSLLMLALGLVSPTAQPARAQGTWSEGLYTGWVYFLARADVQYSMSVQGASIQFAGARFYESHGNIECQVLDADGTGHCAASFPMDIIYSAFGSYTAPDCSATTQVNSRANAIDPGPSLPPLVNNPLEAGFSMSFDPQMGPESGTITVNASGCPGGGSSSFQDTAGEPQWPALDFKVGFASALSFGGTCSMQGLPKTIGVGAGSSTLSLVQCMWRVLYFDPYATLPEE
jgi:hypothetical protein